MNNWFPFWGRNERSAKIAKDRLQIIVARERAACSGQTDYLPQLQQELLQVIAKYERVDLDHVDVQVERRGDSEVLALSITLPEPNEPPRSSRAYAQAAV